MWRKLSVLLTGLVVAQWGLTVEAADPLEVIKKAIDAQGGEENLKKNRTKRVTGKGIFKVGAAEVKLDLTIYYHLPDKLRTEGAIDTGDGATKIVQVFNGKQGWQKLGDIATTKANDGLLKAVKKQLQVDKAATLTSLLDKEKYSVTRLFGDYEVKGKKTICVKIENDAGLYVIFNFDPKSHVIVKQEFATVNFFTGKEVLQEVFLSEYKSFDGLLVPTKHEALHDGKLFMTGHLDDVQFDAQLDASLFEKPE